jgi:hypothetical protein
MGRALLRRILRDLFPHYLDSESERQALLCSGPLGGQFFPKTMRNATDRQTVKNGGTYKDYGTVFLRSMTVVSMVYGRER